jgi:AcrR family transcriptional regulator
MPDIKKAMAGKRKTLAPQQERSRESLRKLMKAAAEVLGQHGVEGTTIPHIAHHAGLTPGAVYRRFRDKDALLETVILGIMQRQNERIRVVFTPAMARQVPLSLFAEQLISSLLISYRASAGLLRGIRQFVQARPKTAFYRKVVDLEFRSYRYVVDLFLAHRKEIKHPNPKRAISFALMMLSSSLIELILVDHDLSNWQQVIPKDDQSLKRELLRAFLGYLGVQ